MIVTSPSPASKPIDASAAGKRNSRRFLSPSGRHHHHHHPASEGLSRDACNPGQACPQPHGRCPTMCIKSSFFVCTSALSTSRLPSLVFALPAGCSFFNPPTDMTPATSTSLHACRSKSRNQRTCLRKLDSTSTEGNHTEADADRRGVEEKGW